MDHHKTNSTEITSYRNNHGKSQFGYYKEIYKEKPIDPRTNKEQEERIITQFKWDYVTYVARIQDERWNTKNIAMETLGEQKKQR